MRLNSFFWKFLIITGLGLGLAVFGTVSSREISVLNEATVSPSPSPAFSFLEKIKEGIDLLKSSPALAIEYKVRTLKNGKKIKTSQVYRRQIALALLDTTTGEVFEKRVWFKEVEVKNFKKTGIVSFEPALAGERLDIQPKWWNSFNSFIEVENRPELVVVANKYPILSSNLGRLPERSKNQHSDIIYVPYSKALHLRETVEAGFSYSRGLTDLAFNQLAASKVGSISVPGQSVTSTVTKEFIQSILLIEHIDPDSFNIAVDGGRELTERVLVILGTNQGKAYRYTGSPAGANGLAQFIAPTYATIVGAYPSARLIKDYNLGMADHPNAIKAMVLFFDYYRKGIDSKITRRDVIKQIGITEEMLAAAYNGGPNRVVRSVNRFGLAWLSRQFNLPRVSQIFRNETLNYLKKFESVKNLELF